jgi:hypothetical protein
MNSMWVPPRDGLSATRRYLAVIALGNLIWEFAHMPLYTLWQSGTAGEIFFAVIHCTGGDVIIAAVSLVLAILISGRSVWPGGRFLQVAATAVILGLSYTVFSEWLNVEIRGSWAYADLMPEVPWLGTGLSPLAQWVVVPGLAFWRIRRSAPRPSQTTEVQV